MEKKKVIIIFTVVAATLTIGGIFLTLWAFGAFSSSETSLTTTTTPRSTTESTIKTTLTPTVSTPSTTPDPTKFYTAAVVEYVKEINEADPGREARANMLNYVRIIHSRDVEGSDIIVFPEGGLNNLETAQLVPEPEDGVVPCRNPDYDQILSQLSCAAERDNLYVVVNLIEKSTCPDAQQIRLNDPRPCSERGINYYNTNVVFDRTGKVVAKYRKYNLFNETELLQPYKPETSTFTTEHGHTFGLFTCFDILFESPAYDLVKQGITNFITTSQWFSELPYLTGVQTHRAWAHTHNVNLLAAGYNNPLNGSSGSGIYHGQRGAMRYSINGELKTEVLKATVPQIGSGGFPNYPPNPRTPEEMLGLSMIKDQVENFTGRLIDDVKGSETSFNLCHGNLCCNFTTRGQVTQRTGRYYEYYAFVYNGMRSFAGAAEGHVKLCGIAACTSTDQKTCGDRFPAGTVVENRVTFDFIRIEGDFKEEEDGKLLMLPSTIDTSIIPYTEGRVSYFNDKMYTMLFTGPRDDLLSFGLYGIVYGTKR